MIKKRWDDRLQCWVLANDSGTKKYDAKERKWVPAEDYVVGTCETPVKTVSATNKHDSTTNYSEPHWKSKEFRSSGTTSASTYTYKPAYPWDNIDRTKWPHTWWNLLIQYHSPSWHYSGQYISDADWQDRLKGIYRPTPKYYNGYYHAKEYGYYGEEE